MRLYHRVISPKDADGMENSVDQTAPVGAPLFAQLYLSKNLGSLWYSACIYPLHSLQDWTMKSRSIHLRRSINLRTIYIATLKFSHQIVLR